MTSLVIPIEKLPDVVLGRDPQFARSHAMAQLATSQRPDRETLLAQVLENTHEPRRHKAVAAIALGRIATPSAENILLRNLPKTSDNTFSEVVRSLGQIGGPGALDAIEALKLPPQHPSAGTAAYAATLIAHRLGLPGHELPFPAEENILKPPSGQTRSIEFGAVEAAVAREVLDAMQKHPYGIEFDLATLTRTRCAGETNIVCPNRQFLGTAVARLTERKAILALVALQSSETVEYSVSYVVLSRPSGAGTVAIMIHRCSGKLALAGTARIVGARLDFELRSVRQPGAWATSLKGTMEDGRLQISEAISSTTQEKRRVPSYRAR